MYQITNEQLLELLTLAFQKLSKSEIAKQAIFDEIANYPDRKMRESESIPKLINHMNGMEGNSMYEHFKSILK
jgi:hypothetical protein